MYSAPSTVTLFRSGESSWSTLTSHTRGSSCVFQCSHFFLRLVFIMAVSDSDSEVSSKAKVRNGKKKVVDSDSESEKQKVSEVDEDDEEYEIEDILEAKRSTISPVRTFPCLTRSSGKEREIVVDIDSNTFLGLAYIPCEVERVWPRAQQLGGRK